MLNAEMLAASKNAPGSGGSVAREPAQRDGGDSAVSQAGVKIVPQDAARNTAVLTDAIFEN